MFLIRHTYSRSSLENLGALTRGMIISLQFNNWNKTRELEFARCHLQRERYDQGECVGKRWDVRY